MKEKIDLTYIDTYNFDYYWWEEQYQNIYQVFAPTNKEVVDYYSRCIDKDSAKFWNDLENCKYNEIPCVITGTMYISETEKKIRIFPFSYPNIVEAIYDCVNNKKEYIVQQENQHIEVKVYHADGFSEYTIWLLNKQGIRAYEKILNGNGHASLALPCYHKKLTECLLDAYN